MCAFSTYQLLWGIQFLCSLLSKTVSPTVSLPKLPVVLYVGLRPPGFYTIIYVCFTLHLSLATHSRIY